MLFLLVPSFLPILSTNPTGRMPGHLRLPAAFAILFSMPFQTLLSKKGGRFFLPSLSITSC